MKEIVLLTKKIKLQFDENGISLFKLSDLIDEVEKDYKIMDTFPSVALFEDHQLITFRVIPKKDGAKKPLGFSMTGNK